MATPNSADIYFLHVQGLFISLPWTILLSTTILCAALIHTSFLCFGRYVDTFNKGGGNSTNLFKSPSVPSNKSISSPSPKFFVPMPVSSAEQPAADDTQQATSGNENPVSSSLNNSIQSVAPPSYNMQKFPSMNNIPNKGTTLAGTSNSSLLSQSRRAASWSGVSGESFPPQSSAQTIPLGEVSGMPPSSFKPSGPPSMHSSVSGGSYGENLHEVDL